MIGHTAFLVTARRMAPGEQAPMKKRRPAPGAYGPDYTGPRPAGVPVDLPDYGRTSPIGHQPQIRGRFLRLVTNRRSSAPRPTTQQRPNRDQLRAMTTPVAGWRG